MEHAIIHEIFTSIQGEGPWIGERQVFVRFAGCDVGCRYCDTAAAAQIEREVSASPPCRIQSAAEPDQYTEIPNPVSSADLTAHCRRFIIPGPSHPTLSITGGEPLLQCAFLAQWLPAVRDTFRIYLETNGIHANAMQDLRDLIDVVSMDFKLPSATGLKPFWAEHKEFLAAARGRSLFVKSVVTDDASRADLVTAAQILAGFDKSIPLILQPAGGRHAPGPEMLMEFQRTALSFLEDVRVIPQAHKILELP